MCIAANSRRVFTVSQKVLIASVVIVLVIVGVGAAAFYMSQTPMSSSSATESTAATSVPMTTAQLVTVNRYVGGLTTDEAPVYSAIVEGFYQQNGINLNQIILGGTSAAVTATASDRSGYAFALGDILDLVVLSTSNSSFPQVVETGSTGIVNPIAVMTLASSNINTPKDLIGKTIGVPFGSLSYKEFTIFLQHNGISANQVNIQNVGFDTIDQALFSHKIDADVHFYAASISTEAQSYGETLKVMFISQYGVPPIGSGVVMQQSLISKDPRVAGAITNATLWGYWFCIKNPDQCAMDFVKQNPNYNFTSVDSDWKSALVDEVGYNVTTIGNWNALQFGYINGTQVANIVNLTTKLYNITAQVNPSSLYTNQFTQAPPMASPSLSLFANSLASHSNTSLTDQAILFSDSAESLNS